MNIVVASLFAIALTNWTNPAAKLPGTQAPVVEFAASQRDDVRLLHPHFGIPPIESQLARRLKTAPLDKRLPPDILDVFQQSPGHERGLISLVETVRRARSTDSKLLDRMIAEIPNSEKDTCGFGGSQTNSIERFEHLKECADTADRIREALEYANERNHDAHGRYSDHDAASPQDVALGPLIEQILMRDAQNSGQQHGFWNRSEFVGGLYEVRSMLPRSLDVLLHSSRG